MVETVPPRRQGFPTNGSIGGPGGRRGPRDRN